MATLDFTEDRCIESAMKYKTVESWIKLDRPAYDAAVENNWIMECVEKIHNQSNFHMEQDECVDEALLFSTIDEYRNEKPDSYYFAVSQDWLDDITRAMKTPETTEP